VNTIDCIPHIPSSLKVSNSRPSLLDFITDTPPDVTCMRCVPAAWCFPTSITPIKVWDDTGAGGGKPGSIWTVNSLDMVAVVAGHDPPQEVFYEFKSQVYSLEGMSNPDRP
jgi:hypothetical protein